MSLQSVVVDVAALVPASWWELAPTVLFGSLPMLGFGLAFVEARLRERRSVEGTSC